ncbi:MAG: Lrp/AsnC family transcriptional regulator [Candidatus Asgardarchaeia archaeon]|nr:Lrp/AsnC family transcriptional regulator [Candidatus Odinarchaeota archaeon]
MIKIDNIDFKILKELQENGRITLAEISRKIGVPDSTVYDRINRLKEKGIIMGFTVVLSKERLGVKTKALVGIETKSENYNEVARELSKIDEILEVYGVTGEFDLMIKIETTSTEELSKILNKIRSMKGIDDIFIMTVLEIFKEEVKLPLNKIVKTN